MVEVEPVNFRRVVGVDVSESVSQGGARRCKALLELWL